MEISLAWNIDKIMAEIVSEMVAWIINATQECQAPISK
jgi:hypothetical protein